MRSSSFLPALAAFLAPLVMLVLSSLPGSDWLLTAAVLVLTVIAIALYFIPKRPRWLAIAIWTVLVLALIGSTNWFYSPFFFALYLLAIALGFLYTPLTAIAFTVGLITTFSFQFGEQDLTYDFMVLLSLLSVIPITIALRRHYLIIRQERKDILILEEDRPQSGVTSLDAILTNQVNRIGVTLRQPITYIKQGLYLLINDQLTEKEARSILPRMQKSADELFTLVKEFERGATRNEPIRKRKQP